jgi:hypothetical protein
VAVVAVAVLTLPACGKRTGDRDALRAAVARTDPLPKTITYVERLTGTDTVQAVQAEVADAFRYKARLLLNGKPQADEVVADDAVAVRLADQGALALLLEKGAVAPASAGGAPAPMSAALDALNTGHWVVDPVGAPAAVRSATDKVKIGEDPVRDALTVLQYVDQAINDAGGKVVRFNPDSLTPTYKAKEDPFPRPKKGAGVIRFDLVLRDLPRRSDVQGGSGNVAVPGVGNFRKMAVYVTKGRVVEVREDIDVVNRLDDLRKSLDIDLPADQSPDQQATFALNVINAVREGQGLPAIRMRTLQVSFGSRPTSDALTMPADATNGDLSLLRGLGRRPATDAGAAPSS